MTCSKCGAEVNGKFCPKCGEKIGDTNSVEYYDSISEASVGKEQEKGNLFGNKENNQDDSYDIDREANKCLIWGILGLVLSCILIGVPLAIIAVIKGVKILRKQKNTKALIGVICGGFVIIYLSFAIVFGIVETIKDSYRDKQLAEYMNNQQYEEAIQMLESYDLGGKKEFETYCAIYEATDDYDEMVDLIVSYYDSEDTTELVDNSSDAIEKLDIIYAKVSEDNKAVIDAYKNKISNVKNNLAVEAQKVEAEAKKAEAEATLKQAEADKAEAEAKKAESDMAAAEEASKKVETDVQNNTTSSLSTNESVKSEEKVASAKYSNDEILKMCMDYYLNLYGTKPPHAIVDHEDENTVTVQLCEEIDEDGYGCNSWAFYTIDKNTLCGYDDVMGDKIDLSEIANSVGNTYDAGNDINQAPFVSYKDLLRYPEQYEGKYIKLYISVSHEFDSSEKVYNAYCGELENAGGIVYLQNDGYILAKNDTESRWLDGDIWLVYGQYQGEHSYNVEYKLTGNKTVEKYPVIIVTECELIQE